MTGRARGLLREIISPGRAKLGEVQGAVEKVGGLVEAFHAKKGCSDTQAEDIRMAALEVLLSFFFRDAARRLQSARNSFRANEGQGKKKRGNRLYVEAKALERMRGTARPTLLTEIRSEEKR